MARQWSYQRRFRRGKERELEGDGNGEGVFEKQGGEFRWLLAGFEMVGERHRGKFKRESQEFRDRINFGLKLLRA